MKKIKLTEKQAEAVRLLQTEKAVLRMYHGWSSSADVQVKGELNYARVSAATAKALIRKEAVIYVEGVHRSSVYKLASDVEFVFPKQAPITIPLLYVATIEKVYVKEVTRETEKTLYTENGQYKKEEGGYGRSSRSRVFFSQEKADEWRVETARKLVESFEKKLSDAKSTLKAVESEVRGGAE
jgi:hypothetical protein